MISGILAIALTVCFNNVRSIDSDSLFIQEYKAIVKTRYEKWHNKAEKKSFKQISKTDSLLFIPVFSLKNNLSWDYDDVSNNAKFASWNCLELSKRWYIDAILVRDNCVWKDIYLNTGRYKREQFVIWDYRPLLSYFNQLKPECVFTIFNVPGYFFIKEGRIILVENNSERLIIHENAKIYLKEVLTSPLFLPVFSGQEY